MANEISTSTYDDLTYTAAIAPIVIAALSEKAGLWRTSREFNLIDAPSAAQKIPTETPWWGTANDDGAGVDTEFDGSQLVDVSNTSASTGSVTISAGEYVVGQEITDYVLEDTIRGIDLFMLLRDKHIFAIDLAMTDDFCALFAGLSNSVGSSGSNLTVAQAISAQQGLRIRGAESDTTMYVLDNQQSLDIETDLMSTNAAAAVLALSADRLIGYAPTPDHGMGASRVIMRLRGNLPVVATGLTDTANGGADVVGACYCASSAANDAGGATTFGHVWKRLPRLETDRIVAGRSTLMVTSARWGCGELQDGSGGAIITDA